MDSTSQQRKTVEIDNTYVRELNDLLATTYAASEDLQRRMLARGHGPDITVSESRLLEAVGDATLHGNGTITITEIARELDIRVPSVTAAVNHLVDKNLLEKKRSEIDARRVLVTLTHSGELTYRLHSIFYRKLAEVLAQDMTVQELSALLKGVRRLETFYSEQKGAQ